jgi:hypothetical protein
MKQILTILLLLNVINLSAQITDRRFIIQWLKLCDDKIEAESVRAYFIDHKYFDDSVKIDEQLNTIPLTKIKSISYSPIKMDNYVPGKGEISISTVQKSELNIIEDWIKRAKELFVDKYVSASQHILSDSKDPVLVVDGQAVSPPIAKAVLGKIDVKEIYDISAVDFFPAPSSIFGQNAKNGLVQIWTKQKYNE